MLGLNFGRVPVPVVYAAASIIGIGERRKNAFGSDGSFDPEPNFEESVGNSLVRYNYYFKKTLEDPYLQTCAPSIQWGKQAARACSFVFTQYAGIRKKGVLGYFKTFLGPSAVLMVLMLPLNLVEQVVRPFSLAMRLYGNIFGEETVVEQMGNVLPVGLPVVMQALSLLFGVIQAMVFTTLLANYLEEATE